MAEPTTIYCTTREAAQALGISLRTAQLWVERGLLEAWKTDGGHRRITRSSVEKLLNTKGRPPAATGEATAGAIDRIKVLVVEDDGVLLKLYKTVIASWDMPIDIVTASNGVEGLIRIGRDSPDLMITDLAMPGMDGFELIRHLALSSLREGMEIVVVTGLDAAQVDEHGGLPNDVRFFSKPVPFAELRRILGSIITRRASYL